jgi:hypothetical protein
MAAARRRQFPDGPRPCEPPCLGRFA